MFSTRGFEVAAISGKAEQASFLKKIGARKIISRDGLLVDKAPLAPPLFAAALDNVGGVFFDRLAARLQPYGKLAVAGMAVGADLHTTVLPWVLRAIDVLGINLSRQLHMEERKRLWKRMATDLKPSNLAEISRPIPFEKLDEVMDQFFNVTVVGRIVVEVGSKAPQ